MSSSNADTLHSVARRMAAAGRLPGIVEYRGRLCRSVDSIASIIASDADLAWAAIQHAIGRDWEVDINFMGMVEVTRIAGLGPNILMSRVDGTTALSVLLAVERACDAAEANGGGR